MFKSLPASPTLDSIDDAFLGRFGVRMDVLRLDRIHPLLNGNKWFKLRLNLQEALRQGHNRLLSFGGAYSNHLRALSAAARLAGMQSVGVVRGEIVEPLNPVLAFARQQGMELHAVSRSDYRHKYEPEFIDRLAERFGDFYLIPEGGSNRQGVEGCGEILDLLGPDLMAPDAGQTILAVACGTGATLAGLIRGAQERDLAVECLGVAVLKGAGFLSKEVEKWLEPANERANWQLHIDHHCGGYARSTPALLEFIDKFAKRTGIPLEPVYTGKLVYALYQLIERGEIAKGSRVIWLHTGGIY
ncbi:MAG: pyridoxal-phosphate dependent enzyme [Gammaproteobacteria bacterium]|nr:pyridoxal-phosphate dependent enzyme [Gammaproteobacteria bacterium]